MASGQTANRERVQPYPSADNWLKALLSKALPTRARPSFSHCQSLPSSSLHQPLCLLHQTADRRSKKNHNPTAARTKPHYRKPIRMKKQRVMSQMKGQDKTHEKQLNEVELGNLPEKSVEWQSSHPWFSYFHRRTGIGKSRSHTCRGRIEQIPRQSVRSPTVVEERCP